MAVTEFGTPNSICVIRLSAIGDVCHAVSAVQAIQRRQRQATITWIIGKVEHELVKGLTGVEFIVFDKQAGVRAYTSLRRRLQGRHFDVLLHMQVALRANLVAAVVSADRKIGFDKDRAKEGHGWFVSRTIKPQQEPHVLEGFAEFARTLGVNDPGPLWQMPYSEQDEDWALEALAGREKVFTIAPAASKAERNWTVEGYASLADYAAAKGYNPVLTGGPAQSERQLAEAIVLQAKSSILNLVGKTSLKQLLCVLKHSHVLMAPDTGPAHMAVTVGTPVIGLYAHSNPKRTGPYGNLDNVVDVYQENLKIQSGSSAQKVRWGHRLKGSNLMDQISVERVQDMFDRVTANLQPSLPDE
jgi:heptosyltransferase I